MKGKQSHTACSDSPSLGRAWTVEAKIRIVVKHMQCQLWIVHLSVVCERVFGRGFYSDLVEELMVHGSQVGNYCKINENQVRLAMLFQNWTMYVFITQTKPLPACRRPAHQGE